MGSRWLFYTYLQNSTKVGKGLILDIDILFFFLCSPFYMPSNAQGSSLHPPPVDTLPPSSSFSSSSTSPSSSSPSSSLASSTVESVTLTPGKLSSSLFFYLYTIASQAYIPHPYLSSFYCSTDSSVCYFFKKKKSRLPSYASFFLC